jgi:hypothetical protein
VIAAFAAYHRGTCPPHLLSAVTEVLSCAGLPSSGFSEGQAAEAVQDAGCADRIAMLRHTGFGDVGAVPSPPIKSPFVIACKPAVRASDTTEPRMNR